MTSWKILVVPLALLIGALVYGAGLLVGTPERPAIPTPIVLQESGPSDERGRDVPGARDRRGEQPADPATSRTPRPAPEEKQDDVVVVTPEPTAVRDDGDDEAAQDDDEVDDDGTDDDSEGDD